MITFLGDVALLIDGMKSLYQPELPYAFNLEYVTCRSNDNLIPTKDKINLFSTIDNFENIFGANPIAVNMVNNHIHDYGDLGYRKSLSAVSKKGIIPIIDKPVFINENLCIVSYMHLANNNYFKFDYDKAEQTLLSIKHKNANARVVVQLHWGVENNPNETKEQKEIAHWLIDRGVDLIIGHHPHCLQPAEEYKGKMIFYSLGNALFSNINVQSHFDENNVSHRKYRFKWQKWNRKSIAVVYDEQQNKIVKVDQLYQKGNTLFCKKSNIPLKKLVYKSNKFRQMVYKFRKYWLFFASNCFVEGKIFDLKAFKHELRRK